jgi:hypothetical protein
MPVVVELNSPATLVLQSLTLACCDIVAHDLNVPPRTEKSVQESSNDRLHATTEDDNRNVVLLCPIVELLEAGVELDVLEEDLDALVEGSLDAVKHLDKAIAEMHLSKENVLVKLATALNTEAKVVGHVVIRIGGSDGAVEVGKEDELGVVLKSWSIGRSHDEGLGILFVQFLGLNGLQVQPILRYSE